MRVLKSKNGVRIGDWEILMDQVLEDGWIWFHIHGDTTYEWSGEFYGCYGDPPRCRVCKAQVPEETIVLGALQKIGLARGD